MLYIINNYLLIILVIVSIYFDLTKKKIPNMITFPVIIWGLLTFTIFSGFSGFKFTIIGFLVGLCIYLIPFILGGMGAGDVKLMAAIGALMGWKFVLKTALAAGLVGGIMIIIYLIYKKQLGTYLRKYLGVIIRPIIYRLDLKFNNKKLKKAYKYFLVEDKTIEKQYIPYGVAIGIGAISVFFI